jgi:hypothetical protein
MIPEVVELPLSALPADLLSFTYCDSFYTFSATTLRGVAIPHAAHRSTLYRLEDLAAAVARFGLPAGYRDPEDQLDVYIEAQVWDDAVLAACLGSGIARLRPTAPASDDPRSSA